MQVTRRLKPSEVNANYSALPEDINSYIDNSVMAKQPEIDLWEFMKTRPDKLYEEWAYEIGSDLTTEHKAVPLTKLDINEDDFFKFMKEEVEPLQKIDSVDGDEEYGASFPTIHNTQGRQREHHRLLDEYGFPAEIEPEMARYTPVLEEDPSPFAHKKVPWSVNEAGDNLGIRHYEDALTMPVIGGHWVKPGVTEGGNSNELPVCSLTKSYLE